MIKLPALKIPKQNTAVNFNKKLYSSISAGHQRLMSTYLWMQTLVESDLKHYKKPDFNNWMYHRFDAMTHLEPKFYAAYRFGAQYLSIIKDDEIGALEIYTRGLKQYPDDYELNFNLGFHYLFEMGDYENAYKVFEKIMLHKEAPIYLPSLVSKIVQKQGNYKAALQLLRVTYEKTDESSPVKKSLFNKMYSLKAKIDLDCLNIGKSLICDKVDLEGSSYKLDDGKFYAPKKWKLPKINFKQR